jgi:hypothetical protein
MSDLVTIGEITCTTCGKFGCACRGQQPKPPKAADICPVCKRNKVVCICQSHPPESLADGVELGETPPALKRGRWTEKQVDEFVREAARAYYNERDWNTIERIIRDAAD